MPLVEKSPSAASKSASSSTSLRGSPVTSPEQGSPAASPSDGDSATSSPKGSPVTKPHIPVSAPAKVVPATSDKKNVPTPSSTSSPPPAKKVSADGGEKKKEKVASKPLAPKPSSSSSDESSSSDSTTEKKVRRKAEKRVTKAEKETRALAASYSLVKSVTDKFPKLGNSNYDPWRRMWGQEFKTLGWSSDFMSIDGPELDLESEHRKVAAQMVNKTIDQNEHELWLRDTDRTNPQAIFRRLHLKFRGSDNIAVVSQIECQLMSMTMKSTRLTIAEYGTAIVETMRKLSELGSPFCELKMINLYLLGLNKLFDPIRFEVQKQIEKKKSKAPKTMAVAKKIVEDWAIRMRDRGLVTFKDTSGGDPKTTVLTLLGDVKKGSPEACRGWLKFGKCKANDLGKCSYQHDMKKKGINAPSPAVLSAGASANKGLERDFTNYKCTECNTLGHSSVWGKCPTKLARKAERAAKNVMHIQPAAPAAPPAPTATQSSKTPSILPLTDTMTVSERALHGYNEKLLNILNVLAPSLAGNPLMDQAALMQAFSGNPFGR